MSTARLVPFSSGLAVRADILPRVWRWGGQGALLKLCPPAPQALLPRHSFASCRPPRGQQSGEALVARAHVVVCRGGFGSAESPWAPRESHRTHHPAWADSPAVLPPPRGDRPTDYQFPW